MRKSWPTVIAILVIVAAVRYFESGGAGGAVSPEAGRAGDPAAAVLAEAYRNRQSDLQVTGEGVVRRVLADDRDGDRHQRFVLELSSGQTVLVAHNIDLAPRIPDLAPGDRVAFNGEYEWNEQGGIIHWTHLDPAGRHEHGWLERGTERFQ